MPQDMFKGASDVDTFMLLDVPVSEVLKSLKISFRGAHCVYSRTQNNGVGLIDDPNLCGRANDGEKTNDGAYRGL